MTRQPTRRIVLLLAALASSVLAACADPTAPRNDTDRGGTYGGSGTKSVAAPLGGTYGGSGT